MANILYGKAVSDSISKKTKKIVENLKQQGKNVTLAIVRVGKNADDISYEKAAIKRCQKLNINVKTIHLDKDVKYNDFIRSWTQCNDTLSMVS